MKGETKMKKSHEEFYYINKECGNLVRKCEIFADAIDNGYDDITDPIEKELVFAEFTRRLSNY